LHEIFSELSYAVYQVRPRTTKIVSRSTYVTQLYSKAAVNELKEFSPELNIRNGGVPSIQVILEGRTASEGRSRKADNVDIRLDKLWLPEHRGRNDRIPEARLGGSKPRGP